VFSPMIFTSIKSWSLSFSSRFFPPPSFFQAKVPGFNSFKASFPVIDRTCLRFFPLLKPLFVRHKSLPHPFRCVLHLLSHVLVFFHYFNRCNCSRHTSRRAFPHSSLPPPPFCVFGLSKLIPVRALSPALLFPPFPSLTLERSSRR